MFSLAGIQKTGNLNLTPSNLFLKNQDEFKSFIYYIICYVYIITFFIIGIRKYR